MYIVIKYQIIVWALSLFFCAVILIATFNTLSNIKSFIGKKLHNLANSVEIEVQTFSTILNNVFTLDSNFFINTLVNLPNCYISFNEKSSNHRNNMGSWEK